MPGFLCISHSGGAAASLGVSQEGFVKHFWAWEDKAKDEVLRASPMLWRRKGLGLAELTHSMLIWGGSQGFLKAQQSLD